MEAVHENSKRHYKKGVQGVHDREIAADRLILFSARDQS